MEFKKVLERYHISPLKYDDGVELSEKDYDILFKMFEKVKALEEFFKSGTIPEKLSVEFNKLNSIKKNSLFELSDEECLDIIMNKNSQEVL